MMIAQYLGAATGVALILAVLWILGGLRTARIASPEAASSRLRQDWPDCMVRDLLVSCDGSVALAETTSGEWGIVFAVGNRLATRRLSPDRILSGTVKAAAEGLFRLEVQTREFTRGDFNLFGNDLALLNVWARRLSPAGGQYEVASAGSCP